MDRKPYDYDVVLLSDLRYPGGNSASVAEEVRAQAAAGYTTALVHVRAPHMMRERTFNQKILDCLSAGLATLESGERRIRTRALVIRNPRVLTADLAPGLQIDAEATVLLVNHPPVDRFAAEPYYDVAEVRERVEHRFGPTLWAPIGPVIREALVASGGAVDLRPDDWVNIVDVDEWAQDRSAFRADRPVIGRHSRGHASKWPATTEDVLAAYPEDERVLVRILGGAEPALRMLGHQPRNWDVRPFGSVSPQRFLGEIDFFVYYHHPGWVEAFGRNVIEAMASGCPAILPPHFEKAFGDHCLYAPVSGARGRVEELYRDPQRYREWSARSAAYVEDNFSAATHIRRMAELIGEAPIRRRDRPTRPRHRGRVRVLMCSTAWTGLGSITRVLRVASRLPAHVEPVILAPWPAMKLVRAAGWLCEALPPADEPTGGASVAATERISRIAREHRVDRVLIDAGGVPLGAADLANAARIVVALLTAPAVHPSPGAFVALQLGDAALAPGTSEGVRVLLGDPEPLSCHAARERLRLSGGKPVVLLTAGADDRSVMTSRLLPVAQALLANEWEVVFAEPMVGRGSIRLPADVRRMEVSDLPPVLPAFDCAVARAGHTLAHELIRARLPSLFVPFTSDRREARRAAAARSRGLALAVDSFDEGSVVAEARRLRDPEVRDTLATACAAVRLVDAVPAIVRALELDPVPPLQPEAAVGASA